MWEYKIQKHNRLIIYNDQDMGYVHDNAIIASTR